MVSALICVGYSIDYTSDVVVTILMIEGVLDLDEEALYMICNHLVLTLCIFTAYIILIKVFIAYQNQVNETLAKIEA